MNNKFWLDRYTSLRKNGIVGSMSYGDEFQDRVNIFFTNIKDVLKIKTCGTLVDFGCGTAKYAKLLKEHFKCKKYIGIDIIDFLIDDNIEKLPGYEFRVYDKTIPKADIIFMASLFQHMDDKEVVSTLKKFKTALIPKGKVYIIDFVGDHPNDDYTYYRNVEEHAELITNSGLSGKVVYRDDNNMVVIECKK